MNELWSNFYRFNEIAIKIYNQKSAKILYANAIYTGIHNSHLAKMFISPIMAYYSRGHGPIWQIKGDNDVRWRICYLIIIGKRRKHICDGVAYTAPPHHQCSEESTTAHCVSNPQNR